MGLTRKQFVGRAGVALTAAGLYGVLESLGPRPARAFVAAAPLPPEQHLLRGLQVVSQEGVEVVIPPLYHQVVTARLSVPSKKAALTSAAGELEHVLRTLERRFRPTPAGLGVTVAWGEPYFRRYVSVLRDGRRFPKYLPLDRRASKGARRRVPALLPSPRFKSDPAEVVHERNDLAILFRSDSLDHVFAGADAVFEGLAGLFEVTSVRKGFVGGGFGEGQSIPRRMAIAAGVPGAELIPEGSQLFLGFTSTQKSALGPDRIANFEALPGFTDQWPNGYFRHGTTMHLSHLFEDLEQWWKTFSFAEQAQAVARPGIAFRDKQYTLPQDVPQAESRADVERDLAQFKATGHSGTIQSATRLTRAVVDHYGRRMPRGTTPIQRADFNTLYNPFFWSGSPGVDRQQTGAAAGLHFVAFAPTSDTFHRARRAMDGQFGDGRPLALDPRSRAQGLNSVIRATHRQNFLVPPRRHRSFPLAELRRSPRR